MFLRYSFLGAALLIPTFGLSAFAQQTLPVSKGHDLKFEQALTKPTSFKVDSKSADIEVSEVEGLDQLKIEAIYSGEKEAQIVLNSLSDGVLSIEAVIPQETLSFTGSSSGSTYTFINTQSFSMDDMNIVSSVSSGGMEIKIKIFIPKGRAQLLNVHSGSGSLVLKNVSAPVEATAGSGSISLTDSKGMADLKTGSGSILLTRVIGERLRAKTGSGSITSQNSQGSMELHAGSGSAEVLGHWGGVNFESGSGSFTGKNINGDVNIKAGNEIEVSEVQGNITIEGRGGDVEALNNVGSILVDVRSGDAVVKGQKHGPVNVTSRSGDIELDNPDVTDQQAQSRSGNVEGLQCRMDLTKAGKKSKW